MSHEMNEIEEVSELVFDGIEYVNDSDSSCSSTCSSTISFEGNGNNSNELNEVTSNNLKQKNDFSTNEWLQNKKDMENSGIDATHDSKHSKEELVNKSKSDFCNDANKNNFEKKSNFLLSNKKKNGIGKLVRTEEHKETGTSSKNGAKCNKEEVIIEVEKESRQHEFAANIEGNESHKKSITRSSATCQNIKNNMYEEEIVNEINQSKVSHLCNIAALQLYSVPPGLPLSLLVELDLSENNLHEINEKLFVGRCGQNLRKVFLQSNKLHNIPATLLRLPRLEVVNFSNNDICEMPFAIARKERNRRLLPALRSLNLEFNHIDKFPIEIFESCSRLETLRLSENDGMLRQSLPFDRLRECVLAQRYNDEHNKEHKEQTQLMSRRCTNNNEHDTSHTQHVCITMDNHPNLITQMNNEQWANTLPWLHVELHKIYPDKIMENLFIGSLRTAQSAAVYRDLDIEYVLTTGRDLKVSVLPHMKHLIMPLNDFPEENPLPLFEEAIDFINSARDVHKGVLVHCFAGLSRSVVIATAYLMKQYHMRCDEALNAIRNVRPAIRPNEGFVKSLLQFERELFEQ